METHSDKFRYQTDWTFYLSLHPVGFSKSISPNCKRKGITCVSAKLTLQGRQSLSGLRETMTCQRLVESSRVSRMELKSDLPLHLSTPCIMNGGGTCGWLGFAHLQEDENGFRWHETIPVTC